MHEFINNWESVLKLQMKCTLQVSVPYHTGLDNIQKVTSPKIYLLSLQTIINSDCLVDDTQNSHLIRAQHLPC